MRDQSHARAGRGLASQRGAGVTKPQSNRQSVAAMLREIEGHKRLVERQRHGVKALITEAQRVDMAMGDVIAALQMAADAMARMYPDG